MTYLGHVVRGISTSSLWIDSGHLSLVVVDKVDGMSLQVAHPSGLSEGGHVVMDVPL